jgi:F0F1-type ATP synthase membrane subunit b/b'
MTKFVDRLVGRTSNQEDTGMARKTDRKNPAEDAPAVARLSDYTARPGTTEGPAGPASQLVGQQEQPADYARLGEHVTAVLEAANEAAAKLRDDARRTAQEIGEHAQQEANGLLEKARAESDQVSHEASRRRIEAEEESRDLKERANAYATEKRREADRQASALVARAKREASEYTKAAHDRSAELAKNVELSEKRLQQLVGGLRNLAVRLEELLQEPRPSSDSANAGAPTNDESMEESLRRSAAAQGPSPAKQ